MNTRILRKHEFYYDGSSASGTDTYYKCQLCGVQASTSGSRSLQDDEKLGCTALTVEELAEQQMDDYLGTLMPGEAIPPETVLVFVTDLVMSGKSKDCLQAAELLKLYADHYQS